MSRCHWTGGVGLDDVTKQEEIIEEMVEITTNEEEMEEPIKKEEKIKNCFFKRNKKWFIGLGSVVVAGVIALGGITYYQFNHFNPHVSINGIDVGGLTPEETMNKLKTSMLENKIYIDNVLILDEIDTKSYFTDNDLVNVDKFFISQRTWFPSSKEHDFTLLPSQNNQYHYGNMSNSFRSKLTVMNKGLKPPQDADVQLKQGEMVILKSVDGNQYDINGLLSEYQKQHHKGIVHLNSTYTQPIKEDNPIIQKKVSQLQELLNRSIQYKVQDKIHLLNGVDVIKNASLSKNGQFVIDATEIKVEISKINANQSTLNKTIPFKTHSGKLVSVNTKGYGWSLHIDKEVKMLKEAFEKGVNTVTATNVYGNGWDKEAVGFHNTTNNGIGDSYAEVSIRDQRMWIYKNGKMVFTTHVVTGRHSTGEDTYKGVWYILFKRSPSYLTGSSATSDYYRVFVNYWAPFTNDGQGFHDASWRTNWSNNAYLTQGSAGCVNVPPSVMSSVYYNVSKYTPVVIY